MRFFGPFILLTGIAAQQMDTGLITGTITDSTGAVIPNVSIEAKHLATGQVTRTTSNEEGRFRTPPLRIGAYELDITAQGFKRVTRTGVTLNVADVRTLDLVLEVGQVSERVEIAGAAPLLQTAESTAGTVITNRQIVDLPLNGRDYLQLALVSAGTAPARGQGVSVGGQRGMELNFVIDGIDNNNQSIASQGNQKEALKPQVDAVQEFKVVTNGFPAEYGRSSAGVVNLTIKSGTNEIHGTLFEFVRNEKLDAKNFFTPATVKKPAFKRNQYGFAAGGPIKKNRAFLFGDLEHTDVRESETSVSTVPALNEKAGRFTREVFDPFTTDAATSVRTPFPDRVIPASRFDPVGTQIATWFPAPLNAAAANNFTFISPRREDHRKWDVRHDLILSDRDNLFFRYSNQRQDRPVVRNLPDASIGPISRSTGSVVDSHNMGLGVNRIWTSSLVTSVRLGWNYIFTNVRVAGDKDLNQLIGLRGVDQTLPGTPEINVTGYRAIGTTNFNPNLINSQTRQLSGDTTWNKGNHAVKFGASIYFMQSHIVNPQRAKGTFDFDGRFTQDLVRAAGGEPMADLLLGTTHTIQGSNFVYMNLRSPVTAYYIQDDWRVSRKLTLNYGLRYEIYPPWVETRNLISNFDIDTNPASPKLVIANTEGSGRERRALQSTDKNNLGPRFGFAYQARGSTVVRGAYGIFYGNVTNTGGGEFMQTNPPFHLKASLTTDRRFPTLLLRNGVPPDAITPQNAQALRLASFERQVPWPIAQQWNFNLQQALPGDMMFEIGYFANKMNHMARRWDANYALPGPGNINARRRYTRVQFPGTNLFGTLSEMNRFQYDGNSLYHSMQMKAEKRYSKGSTFILHYTWSKAIADVGGIAGVGNAPGENWDVQNPLDFRSERSLATNHMGHRFVGSYVYELPFGRGRTYGADMHKALDFLAGGWSLGGILTLAAGTPINLSVVGNPSNAGLMDRPNVVGQWHLPRGERTLQRFFNTSAFVPNSAFQYGNAGRNLLLGPGRMNYDFSAYKNFGITERLNMQFRFEAFNFTNTPFFGAPVAQVGNRNIGVISSADTPRNLQLGLKLQF
ncbi:MAG: TonB-dependent receptor [Acidobacteria bacterium]|nr:TonB-dependent receptor [Acidobacteriota bacterium]